MIYRLALALGKTPQEIETGLTRRDALGLLTEMGRLAGPPARKSQMIPVPKRKPKMTEAQAKGHELYRQTQEAHRVR